MECFSAATVSAWTATASATDNCGGSVTLTPSYTPPPDNCNRTVTVTFTATDNCGKTATATKDFLVNDTTAPTITVPRTTRPMESFCASTVGVCTAKPSATDNCGGSATLTPSYTPPPDNCNRTVTVTFTATDNCGKTATATKDFLVNDTTAPTITVPPTALSMECFSAATVSAWTATASATDNCGGSVTLTPSYTPPPDNCNRTVTVTFTATDNCGKTATATKDFLVNDTTAPTITVPPTALSMESFSAATVSAWTATASATDNCGGSATLTPSYTPPPDNCNRTVTVTFTATDNCGKTATATKDFLVNDTTAPTITVPPTALSMECFSAATVSAWTATASATDNCGGSATLTPSYTPPPDNCNRTVTVT